MIDEPSLLCVHAHPDDEALFTGGILARAHERGTRTGVVTCTWQDGDRRVEELRRSLEILGAGTPMLLSYRDRGTDGPDKFLDAPFDEAVGRLVGHIRAFRPDVLVTYDALGTYGHPDHVLAHRVTLAAAEAAGYPQLYPDAGEVCRPKAVYQATFPRTAIESLWGDLFGSPAPAEGPGVPGVPDDQVTVEVDVRPWVDRKWRALLAHESETQRGAGAARFMGLPDEVRERVFGTEWFLRREVWNR